LGLKHKAAMKTAKFHVHFNSRSAAHRVFHMTDELCKAALARRRDLTGKVRITAGWDLVSAPEALKTAAMLVTSMQVPRQNLRAMAPLLRCIHCIGSGVEFLRPFDWVPKGIEINKSIPAERAKVLPTAPAYLPGRIQVDDMFWAANKDKTTERFNNWVVS